MTQLRHKLRHKFFLLEFKLPRGGWPSTQSVLSAQLAEFDIWKRSRMNNSRDLLRAVRRRLRDGRAMKIAQRPKPNDQLDSLFSGDRTLDQPFEPKSVYSSRTRAEGTCLSCSPEIISVGIRTLAATAAVQSLASTDSPAERRTPGPQIAPTGGNASCSCCLVLCLAKISSA